jgi:hypothetical protein
VRRDIALIDMTSELTDLVPALSRVRAKRLINRAWKIVQDSSLWSFQLQQGGFSTPNISTGGSVTVSLGSNQVIGDAAATAQWLALPFYWSPTTQQFRAQGYSVYSIIAYDNGQTVGEGNYPFATLTLDRNFIDPLPFYAGVAYQMYGAYIPAPKGFKRWLTVADMFDQWSMDIWTGRRSQDLIDPARQVSSNPYRMLPLGTDRRGAGTATPSATLNQQLYELYPYPTTEIAYQWYAVVEWPYLVNNSDTLPPPIDEEVVTQKALTWAYRDAEARRDIMAAKGTVGNYLKLKESSEEDFLTRLKTLRLRDRDAVDAFEIDMRAATKGLTVGPWYNSSTMRSSPF